MWEDRFKAPELCLPPLQWKENNLKEKLSERDTEIDRLRKEVTGLQDQMAGQRDVFQVATESIRRDAERYAPSAKE
jgi:predicted  nucleic acid-binding Zn-ribbon protein